MNISQQVAATNGKSTGFDYLRILLAISVVALHTIPICYGWSATDAAWAGPFRPLLFVIVPSFFALSGFLVAASLERVDNSAVFLTLRALRVLPALACVVLISALLIGPLLTDLPLQEYFSNYMVWAYLLGSYGDVHYHLPGLFSHNAIDIVNASLWTIPYEIKCYLALSVAGMLSITRKPRLFGTITVFTNVVAFLWVRHQGLLAFWAQPTGVILISSFLWGVFLYLSREKLYYSAWICGGAALFAWLVISWSPGGAYLAALPIAYVTIYLGLQNPRKIALIAAGDYSYGVYVYGWPIQQTIAYLFPAYRVWYFNLITSLVVASVFAWLSWTLVESKMLARKGHATRFVDSTRRFIVDRWWKLWRPARSGSPVDRAASVPVADR